jgi:hypothetical protein
MSSPFGAPGSGWTAGGGPFGPTPPQGRRRRNTVIVVVLASAIVLATAAAYMLTRDDSTSEGSRSEPTSAQTASPPDVTTVDAPVIEPAPVATAASTPTATTPAPTTPSPTTSPASVAPPPSAPPPATTPASLFSADRAGAIVDEIAGARGATPLRALRILIYPEYMFAQVQDPTIPDNIDEYQWRGELGAAEPVKLTGSDELEPHLFSASEVNWGAIPALVEAAPATAQIIDGEVTHVIVERPLPFSNDVRLRVFVSGTRADGYIDADADGTVIAINGTATNGG